VLILANGSPTKKFRPTRDFRQSDSMKPFMFFIVSGLTGQTLVSNCIRGTWLGKERYC